MEDFIKTIILIFILVSSIVGMWITTGWIFNLIVKIIKVLS